MTASVVRMHPLG